MPERHEASARSLALNGPRPERAAKAERGRRSTSTPGTASHSSENTAGPANRDMRWRR